MRWQPYLEFYIDNYKDIAAVVKINERARDELPIRIGERLKAALIEDIDDKPWSSSTDAKWEVGFDEDTVWWAEEDSYDFKRDEGPYFGIWPLSLDALIKRETVVFFGFYMEIEKRQKILDSRVKTARLATKRVKQRKKFPDIRWERPQNWKHDSLELCLAWVQVADILNLDALQKRDEMTERVVSRVREFSEPFVAELQSLV